MIPLPEGQTPRRWQVEAWGEIRKGLAVKSSVLVSAATGTGKGTLLAGLCAAWARKGDRVLFLVHREELVRDIAARVALLGVEVGIVMGPQKDVGARVVCASVASLRKPTMDKVLAAGPVAWALTDEAHHAPAPGYKRVYARLREQEGVKLRHVGVTATPYRHGQDGGTSGLGGVFEALVYEYGLKQAIADGVLCPIEALQIVSGVSLAGVDLEDEAAVSAAVDTGDRNQQILRAWQEHARGRVTVGFASGVQHAQHLAELFSGAGVRAAAVWGTDPERTSKVKALRAGELQVLWNCSLFTEGFDAPEISAVLLARPTASAGLYAQMVGRGTRIAPSKKDCLLLDFVDVSERLDIQTAANLMESADRESKRIALKPGDLVNHRHDAKRYDGRTVEILGASATVQWPGREELDLCYCRDLQRVRAQLDGVDVEVREVAAAAGPVQALKVTLFGGRPQGWYHYRNSDGTDRYTVNNGSQVAQLVRERPGQWSGWEVTGHGGQRRTWKLAEGTLAEVSEQVLKALLWKPVPFGSHRDGPITDRQRALLKKFNIRRDVHTLSLNEASALITTKLASLAVDQERKRRSRKAA